MLNAKAYKHQSDEYLIASVNQSECKLLYTSIHANLRYYRKNSTIIHE